MHNPIYHVDGASVTVERYKKPTEAYTFATANEARGRVRFIEEAMTWIGTPFRDCEAIKGVAVDCVMMMARASIDSGLRDEFDPRPYSPRHMLHSEEELFIKYLTEKLGCVEVAEPTLGDLIAWRYGKPYAHGGIWINSEQVLHAHGKAGMVLISDFTDPILAVVNIRVNGKLTEVPRPKKFFNYSHTWKAL